MIIAGCAVADILANNASDLMLHSIYSRNLVKLVRPAEVLSQKGCRFLWTLQDPILKERLPPQLANVDNRQIDVCNKAAAEVRHIIILTNNILINLLVTTNDLIHFYLLAT